MSFLELTELRKVYPGGAEAVRSFTLSAARGEFIVLLGPSGCGKTTTLRMIAGLETPTAGRVAINGRDVTPLRPAKRDVGFMFQFYALYAHLSVRENVLFPLRAAGVSPGERQEALERVSARLGLAPLLDRHPSQLSGGDQQRVALARVMVRKPAVYLMDEPLGTLDGDQRVVMREFIRGQQLESGVTTVFVTHDQEEAMSLADRIVVMKDGDIRQTGSPAEVYDNPASRFVAEFVGSPGMNFIPGAVQKDAGRTVFRPGGDGVGLCAPDRLGAGRAVLGIRPEYVRAAAGGEIQGTVVMNEYMGSRRFVHVDAPFGRLVFQALPDFRAAPGTSVGMGFDPVHCCFFDPDTGERIRE
jgi:multiple sugar transport system ATP-binding protein